MLVYKAQQIVSVSEPEFKDGLLQDGKTPWKNVTVHVTALGVKGGVAVITVKRKTESEIKAALAGLVVGKPGDVPIQTALPLTAAGSNKVVGVQYVA
jgi:hypothetical protein